MNNTMMPKTPNVLDRGRELTEGEAVDTMMTAMKAVGELLALRAQANAAHSQYPQYRGYWDTWVVGTVKRDIRTKLGQAFLKGDRVLVQREIRDITDVTFSKRKDTKFLTAYSFRNRCNTSVSLKDIADVDTSDFPVVTM